MFRIRSSLSLSLTMAKRRCSCRSFVSISKSHGNITNPIGLVCSEQQQQWNMMYRLSKERQQYNYQQRQQPEHYFSTEAAAMDVPVDYSAMQSQPQIQSTQQQYQPKQQQQQQQQPPSDNLTAGNQTAKKSSTTSKRKNPVAPRKDPIIVTNRAAERISELLQTENAKKDNAVGLRLGVKRRGCNGLSYTMNYATETTVQQNTKDIHMKVPFVSNDSKHPNNSTINVYIEPMALFNIVGTTMDFVEDDMGSEFTFQNPNSKGSCGCGESFNV